jgi:Holliday junction resolvase RusA-like endonuclease
MVKEPLFEVELKKFEPHTLQKRRGHRDAKKELREAIVKEMGQTKIEEARKKIDGRPIKIRVLFRLWKGSREITKTRFEKDLDNLLKPVLDVLQTKTSEQKNEPGLDLIENDKLVYEINARKGLVEVEGDEGVRIQILPVDR